MKKLRAPSETHSIVIENALKQGVLYPSLVPVRGVRIGRRIPEILMEIGSEEVLDDRWPDQAGMTKLEAVLRLVFDLALEGDKWCIDFIANRMEGRPQQSITVREETADVRDISTDELIRQAQANIMEARHLAQLEIARLIEAGELVRVETPHRTL